jgi:hypothetical protein
MKSCGPFSASTAAHWAIEQALDHVHGLDQRQRAGCIADTPTGHRIGLGYAVHRERAVVERRLDLGRRIIDEVTEDEMFVHVVSQHPNMGMLHQDVGQRL